MTTHTINATEKTIRARLAEEGIDSLDALIERWGDKAPQMEREESLLALESALNSPAPRAHKVPLARLVIDGTAMAAASISDFNDRALHSVPGLDANGKETLFSFTSRSGLQLALGRIRPMGDDLGTSNPDWLPELSYYFEHDSKGGDWLQNGPGRAWRDLTRVGRGFLNLGDWNDIISSVDWCRWDISLYEHTAYQGSSLYLPAGRTYFHLSQWGWNDRTSSTKNWGRRF